MERPLGDFIYPFASDDGSCLSAGTDWAPLLKTPLNAPLAEPCWLCAP